MASGVANSPFRADAGARRLGRAERRRRIVDAAQQVFVESGFAGARTLQIAERAGVNQALLYQHFASKEALFDASVLEPLESMIAELTALTRSVVAERAPGVRRRRFAEMHERVLATCVRVVPLLGVALFAEGGQAFYRDRLLPLLADAYRDTDELLGSWPVRQPMDGRTAFTMTFGMHLGLALDAHMRGEDLDVARISAALADVVVRGLSLPQGESTSSTSGPRAPTGESEQ